MDEEQSWHEGGQDVPWWLVILVGAGVAVVFCLVIVLILTLKSSG